MIHQVSRFFGVALSKRFAGATIGTADGYWAEDGAEFKSEYEGNILCERVVVIDLSVNPDREVEALDLLRILGRQAIDKFGVAAEEMHIEVSVTRAYHTNLRGDGWEPAAHRYSRFTT